MGSRCNRMTNILKLNWLEKLKLDVIAIAMLTDYDCWHPDHDEVDVNMVVQTFMKNASNAQNMIKEVIKHIKIFL